MRPLLNIQTVPIMLEYQVNRASLQYKSPLPQVNVTRQRGGMEIQRQPAKLKIDSYETRASMGMKSARRSIQEFADAGKTAAREATRNGAELGNKMLEGYVNKVPVVDIVTPNYLQPRETVLGFTPSVRPEISAEGGTISFHYTMDQLTFDWNVHHKPQYEFIPGNIEFLVKQYPSVVVEYVGSPFYVPPSADPDYEPPPELDVSA